jgi:hypothetical protein
VILVAEAAAAAFFLSRPVAESPDSRVSSSMPIAAAPIAVGDRRMRPVSLGGARTDPLIERVASELGDAVAAVERFWGTDWPRDIVVVATDTDAEFAAQAHLDPRRQWADIAAVSVADEVDVTRRQASGQRIVLAPGAARMSDQALRIVLAHELFHYAARADTAPDAPRWLTEGVADYVARPPAPLPSGVGRSSALPSDADLDRPGPDRSAGYDRAWWFARFVADTYGADGLRRLYGQACGPGHGDLATAVRVALGTDLSSLQSQWARL